MESSLSCSPGPSLLTEELNLSSVIELGEISTLTQNQFWSTGVRREEDWCLRGGTVIRNGEVVLWFFTHDSNWLQRLFQTEIQ